MNAVATHSDSFADFLRVVGAIIVLKGAFFLVILGGIAVVGWMMWFIRPIIALLGYAFLWGSKIMAVALLLGIVFAILGKPDLVLNTVFYTAYYFSKAVGAVVGPIIGV